MPKDAPIDWQEITDDEVEALLDSEQIVTATLAPSTLTLTLADGVQVRVTAILVVEGATTTAALKIERTERPAPQVRNRGYDIREDA